MRISRGLHGHAQKLERAVEGTYARESSDPRIRLLSDSLHLSRLADLELGRLSQSLQRVLQLVQVQTGVPSQQAAVGTATPFERERQALNTSLNIIKRESYEPQTLYDIAR